MNELINKQTSKTWLAVDNLLKIDGANGKYISIPANDNLEFYPTRSFSFSVILTKKATGLNQVFLSNLAGGNTGYSFSFTGSGGINLELSSGGTKTNFSIPSVYAINNRSFLLTVSYDGVSKIMQFYSGGLPTGSINLTSYNSNTVSNKALNIGKYLTGSENIAYVGNAGFLSWYSKALTQSEVSALMNEIGLVPKSLHINCTAFYPMQGKYGNKVYDCVEQFNYIKPLNFPPLLIANWTRLNYPSDTNIAYAQGANYLELSAVTIPSNNYAASYRTPYNVPFSFGKHYSVEVDVEIINKGTSDNISFILNGTSFFKNKTTAVRETLKWDFDPISGATDAVFYMEGRFYIGSTAQIRIYRAVMYEKGIGLPLTGNHADLIGFSNTELGIPTKTTQTARVNFYDKTSTSFWDGSGNELKSGLPELKNALQLRSGRKMNLPTSFAGISIADMFSICWQFYVPNDIAIDNAPYVLTCAGATVYLTKKRFTVAITGGGAMNDDANQIKWNKGLHTVIWTKLGIRNFRLMIDGKMMKLTSSTITNAPYSPGLSDITLTSITSHYFDNWDSATPDIYLIGFGIKKCSIQLPEAINMHNNTFFNNPVKIGNWECFYQAGNLNVSNQIPDQANKSAVISMSNFPAIELNPADPSYAIKTINSLR